MVRFAYGTMGTGKSMLALSLAHNLRTCHSTVEMWTYGDRCGQRVSSRAGLSGPATVIGDATSFHDALGRLDGFDHLVIDEVQFADPAHIDILAGVADSGRLEVHCFGLLTDFTTRMFPAAARLIEIADVAAAVPLVMPCWCGRPGLFNGRVVNGVVVKDGDVVAIGDFTTAEPGEALTYQVLCRAHHAAGRLGPRRAA